jgi:hypothetical protein
MNKRARIQSALRRVDAAERATGPLKRKLEKLLRRQVRAYAANPQPSVPADLREQWRLQLEAALVPPLRAANAQGAQLTREALHGTLPKRLQGKSGIEDLLINADFSGLAKWIQTTALSASETQATRLEQIFQRLMQDTTTPAKLAQAILAEGLAQQGPRAMLLARTGTHWAHHDGTLRQYASLGINQSEWLIGRSDGTCEFCRAMNGRRARIGEPYARANTEVEGDEGGRLAIPGGARGFDVKHPPLHPHCRCTTLAVL